MYDAVQPDRAVDLWAEDEPVREPMRPQSAGARRNPSRDDKRIRRRMRRSGAQEENEMSIPDRSQLVQRIASATSLAEQMVLVGQLDELDRRSQRQAALEREVDLSQTSIDAAMMPILSRTAHGTMASDWLTEMADEPLDQSKLVAQAAVWYGQVPEYVRSDEVEFSEQARGMARKIASSMGGHAQAAEQIFVSYAAFLRAQAASGLDQIQQTTAPDGVTQKATPLNPEVFNNFAPPVADINAGVTGTEDSNQAPAIQMAVGGGGNSSPEVPGGHDSGAEMTGPAPEPSLGGGGGAAAEQSGGHSETGEMAAEGVPEQPPAAPPGQGPAAGSGGAQPYGAGGEQEPRKQAASGLPMIQQTTDPHDAPSSQPLPTTVAFPWTLDEGGEADGMTGEAQYDQGGQVSSGHQSHASLQTRADQWTQPHQLVQPNIANSPATTPPRTVADAGSGAADAKAGNQPSFGDAHAAPAYTESYTSAAPAAPAQDVPVSIGGDNGTGRMHPAYASRKVATKQEMQHPDFQKGYKYAAKWAPGTPLVTPGSAELEAGIYAGFTDRPQYRAAWLSVHADLAKVEPKLGRRITAHRQFTHKIAAEQGLPTDGTYLSVQAATGVDPDTTGPATSPSPSGDTPLNGPGRPGPLDGQMGAADPAGPAPYNGAEPFGSPVVPQAPSVPQGQPVHIPDTGMASAAPAGRGLAPTAAAFRRRVQSGLLAEKKG
ncbi:hypothetical protein OG497_37670 [Streptomyces sp. NBC_01242]|uniref:hypothetical protein n=1 Tax=Streptomyces sp. NBC_01242 TaxID=2903795 RepID=UPI00224FF2F8|nr:hypothetical protein [Streptomyces sp. NBC_01242]MCX4799587.1 hypothetical protein [Streptomyces sp. NBC_01242]